jgi:predicted phosphohydrolase
VSRLSISLHFIPQKKGEKPGKTWEKHGEDVAKQWKTVLTHIDCAALKN